MNERSQEGSVEADPGRGRIGHRDSGLCSEAEQWLTTWSRPPPGSCPPLTSTSRCLVFSMALLTVCSVICSLACFCCPHPGRLPQLLHNSTGNLSPCSPLYPSPGTTRGTWWALVLFFLFSFYLFIFSFIFISWRLITYWSLSFWLTSLCVMGSSFIHLIRTDSNAFFLMAE